MSRVTTVLAGVAIASLLAAGIGSPTALADKETSLQLYKAGKRKYELGEYKRAITLFEQAYEEHPFPNYQFNLAMAHLKLESCAEALKYFRSFLEAKPDTPNRDEVEGHIADLSGKCGGPVTPDDGPTNDVPADDPPEQPTDVAQVDPDPDPATATTTSSVSTTAVGPERARFFVASADIGIALYNIGDVIVPATPSIRLAGALPLRYMGIALEPHGAIELQTMAYDHEDTDSTVLFSTLLVGATAMYPAEGTLRFGGDIGFGIFHFSGLKMGNPFIAAGAEQSGSVNALAFRAGLQVEYDIGHGLAAAFSPAYVVSPGADDLRDEISSISRLELMIGARYRL